ncbi:MAG: 5' nucleotidase, NT5C type [Candidatus Bathyarchaeia archaeon]
MPQIRSLAIDVDNVLADSIARWCVLANELGYSVAKEDIKSHKLVGSVSMEPGQIFNLQDAVWKDWKNLPATEPSLSSAINELRQRAVRIVLVTCGPLRHRSDMESWLQVHELSSSEFVCLGPRGSKATVAADALVDDAPDSLSSFISTGRRGFLYSQPWNKNHILPNAIVIERLFDIVKYLS